LSMLPVSNHSFIRPHSVTADSVLEPEDGDERSERLEAMDWLRERLSSGPLPSRQVQDEASAARISSSTLRRAQSALGIKPSKDSLGGGWSWGLPDEDAHQVSKMLTPEVGASSSHVSIFDGCAYTPDNEGPGCTCRQCGHHFGTVAGWRYHIIAKRCALSEEAAD
jgi:hypothetical protein